MYSFPALFWASLTLLATILGYVFARALQRPALLLAWPFIVASMWLYFFGYMAFQAALHLRSSIPESLTLGLGEFVPLVCFIAVLLGWRHAVRNGVRSQEIAKAPVYNVSTVWWVGMFWALVGALGTYSVRAAWLAAVARGEQPDVSRLSGYQVLLYHVGYPGMAMCLWATIKSRGPRRVIYTIALLIAAAASVYPYVSAARRGPVFPLLAIFIFLPPLVTKRRPKTGIIVGGLALSGLIMLALVTVRHEVSESGWSAAVSEITPEDVIVSRTLAVQENEFVNTTYAIRTIYDNGKYQYGSGHLSLLLHWIPRSVWPDKPALGEGSYSWTELYADINARAGKPLVGFGAAIGGVADSFVQYGFLSPLYWLILAYAAGRIFTRAIVSDDPRWHLSYLGVICATHWLVSQSLGEAIVPAAAYQMIPLVTFALCRERTSRRATARRQAYDKEGSLGLNPASS